MKEDKLLETNNLILFTNNDQTVLIRHADSTTNGRYTCQAKNSLGEVTRNFIVKVTGPPILDLSPSGKALEELSLMAGDHVVLACRVLNQNVEGESAINTEWMINGRSISNETGNSISPSVKVSHL